MGSDKDRGKREDRFKNAYERITDKLDNISNNADKHDEKNSGQLDRIEKGIRSIDKRIGIPDEVKRQLEKQLDNFIGDSRACEGYLEELRGRSPGVNSGWDADNWLKKFIQCCQVSASAAEKVKNSLLEQPVVTSGGERYEQESEELLRELYERLDSLEEGLESKIQENNSGLKAELAKLVENKNEIERLRTELSEKEKTIAELTEKAEKLDAVNKEIERLGIEIKDKENGNEKLSKELTTAKEKIDKLSGVNESLEKTITQKESEISQLTQLKNEKEELNTRLREKIFVKDNRIKELENEVGEKKKDISKLESIVSEKEREITALEKKNKDDIKAMENRLENLIMENSGKISTLKKECDDEVDRIRNDANDRIAELTAENERKLAEKDAGINRLTDSLNRVQSRLGLFDDAAEPYLRIYRKMLRCPSMKSAFEEVIGIPAAENISERDTIRFINAFAKDFQMARIIYKSMTREKEISEEPITPEEIELVNELNDFYRTAYGERIGDICALDCLGMDGGGEVPFDRMKMKDFKNVSNTDISRANTLYVPLLRGIRGEVAEKAAIKGK